MKIYLVIAIDTNYDQDESTFIYGIYSTLTKANQRANEKDAEVVEFNIDEDVMEVL